MTNLTDWLNPNKIPQNLKKNNEPVILKHKEKELGCSIKIRLNLKRFYPCKSWCSH